MALTDVAVRKIQPAAKPFKLFDTGGMFLLVTPAGGKLWRFKYRIDGREKLLSLGPYPEVSLKAARLKRDDARRDLANRVDPSRARKAAKSERMDRAANSFKTVGLEWYRKNESGWVPNHAVRVKRLLERDIFPLLGDQPVTEISAPELLKVLRRIESRNAVDTAHRARGYCGEVFRYAIAAGLAERDPAADLREALTTATGSHFAAVLDSKRLGAILRAFDSYQGTETVSKALRLMPMVFVRPGELRTARWADIDLDAGEWKFTTSKTDTPLVVPLAKQAVVLLRDLLPFTRESIYVFPSVRSNLRPMSEAATLVAMRIMGFPKEEVTGHGFRATARTLLEENLGFPYYIIEHQLGHAVRDPNGRAYNRTTFLDDRRKMMQRWADFLDELKADKTVISPEHAQQHRRLAEAESAAT
jgi:integrase